MYLSSIPWRMLLLNGTRMRAFISLVLLPLVWNQSYKGFDSVNKNSAWLKMQTKIVCFIFNQKNGSHWLVKCWLSFNRDFIQKIFCWLLIRILLRQVLYIKQIITEHVYKLLEGRHLKKINIPVSTCLHFMEPSKCI